MPLSLSKLAKGSLAYSTLIDLNNAGIRYCIWKSIDRFEDGTKGLTDFDILFDPEQQQLVFEKLLSNKWIQLTAEPWRSFPQVYDFVCYDSRNLRFIHFHLHFKLITGEKLLKSISLPLVNLYLSTTVYVDGIPHSLHELEFVVFIIRMCVKIKWKDYARAVKWRDKKKIFDDFESEYVYIRKHFRRTSVEDLLNSPGLSFLDRRIILDAYDDLYSLDFFRRNAICRSLKAFRRYRHISRYCQYFYRSYQKRKFGVGKALPKTGKCFAFCGPDGSGKTTLTNMVENALSEHFKVARFYMGGNPYSCDFIRRSYNLLIRFPYKVLHKLFRLFQFAKAVRRIESTYLGYNSYLMAREKLNRYHYGKAFMEQGALVIFERFPLFQGVGDGPSTDDMAPLLRRQQGIYRRIPLPDVIFVIRIVAEESIRRKPDHSADEIRSKVKEFGIYIDNHKNDPKVVVLDGVAPLESNIDIVLKRIVKELYHDS